MTALNLTNDLKNFLQNDSKLKIDFDSYSLGLNDEESDLASEIENKFGPYQIEFEGRINFGEGINFVRIYYFQKYDKYIACYGIYSSWVGERFILEDMCEVLPEKETVTKYIPQIQKHGIYKVYDV